MYVNGKVILVETAPAIVGGNDKNDGRGEFKSDLFHIL
jgi:hypothetical protein